MRVLLAEDNPINQQLAVELMESRGVEVMVANNGQEALDQLAAVAADHYHVVLMDLQMPVMDGYEATRRLRADSRYCSLPLVAMTAHAMVEERERCLVLGMNGHLGKPFEPDDLYDTLARYYTEPAVPVTVPGRRSARRAASSDDTALQLPDIAGLDTATGLRRAVNKKKLYRQLLLMFTNDFADFHTVFVNHFAGEQWEEAERRAHSLKGLAGTIGANDVQLAAAALEAACERRQAEGAAAALTALTPPLTALLTGLRQFFAQEEQAALEQTAAVTPRTDKLPDCLPHLRQLLSEGDSDVIDLWEKHHKEFASVLPPQLAQRIGTALQNFEFDAAQVLLSELTSESPTSVEDQP
jgi:CheY-like chemotaxis protein